MDDITKPAHFQRPDLQVATEGEFAGWRTWMRDSYETHTGPFWHHAEPDGRIRCAFRVQKKHLNGADQDCGDTKPFTFGLMARGLRSWTM